MMRRDRRITLGDDLREVSEWQHTRFVISDADIEILMRIMRQPKKFQSFSALTSFASLRNCGKSVLEVKTTMGKIEIPREVLTLDEAIYLLKTIEGYFDSKGFVVLNEEEV